MFRTFNKLLRSGAAMWTIAGVAMLLLCATAAIAFGMNSTPATNATAGAAAQADNSPSQLTVMGADNSAIGNGTQPAGSALQPQASPEQTKNIPELSAGVNSQVLGGPVGGAANAQAKTNALQGSGNANASANAGANLNVTSPAPQP